MLKYTIDSDGSKPSKSTANKREVLRAVPVEDAAIIEQFPISEQDINRNTIGGSTRGGENGQR